MLAQNHIFAQESWGGRRGEVNTRRRATTRSDRQIPGLHGIAYEVLNNLSEFGAALHVIHHVTLFHAGLVGYTKRPV